MSLEQAQEAAPDAVWTPTLSQDNAGDRARQELDEKAKAKREEEEARARAKRALLDEAGDTGEVLVPQPTDDEVREYQREQEELEELRKKRRHKMSLEQAQEAAPDAVWTPRLSQDNAGDRARQELDEKAKAKREEEDAKAKAKREEEETRARAKQAQEEEAPAKRRQEEAEAARIYKLGHRPSRLRDDVATSFVGRACIFLICLIVSVASFMLLSTFDAFSSMTSTEMLIFVVLVCMAILNFVLGLMWCTNTGWGRSRELVCCLPCVCDEADSDPSYSEDDEDPKNMP